MLLKRTKRRLWNTLRVANAVGAVYILEHYAVDVIFGIILAIISIIMTEVLLRSEKKYFTDELGLLTGFDYIWSILKKFKG